MDKDDILNAFIDHFNEFIDDVVSVFPDDPKVKIVRDGLFIASQFNQKKLIQLWQRDLGNKYREQIMNKDYKFFEDKDYKNDIYHKHKDYILPKIDSIRNTIREMDESNKLKALKYIENLTKLGDLYNSKTNI